MKKIWKIEKKFQVVSETIFSAISRMYSFRLYIQFVWENSRTWDFLTQSWDMRGLDPFRVQSNLANKAWTTHTNRLFECVNHIVFMSLTEEKRPQPQIIYIFGVMVQSVHIFGYCLHLWPCFWTITREPRPKLHVSEFFSHCFKAFNPCKSSK